MQHAILTLVLVASLAQPKLQPAEPPRYVPIPLPDNAEQLLKSIQIDRAAISPEFADRVRDAAEKMRLQVPTDLPNLGTEPKGYEKIAREYLRTHPDLANGIKIDPKDVIKFLEDNPSIAPKMSDAVAPEPPNPLPAAPKSQTLDQRLGRWLADWLQNEDTGGRLVEMMRDSPGFKDALDDLLRSMREVDGGWQPDLPDMPNQFDPPRLPRIGELPKLGVPDLSGAAGWMPKMPRLEMPRFTLPQFLNLSSPELPDLGGDWPQILVAVVLVVGLLAAMRIWATTSSAAANRALLPVPAAIATRAQLLQAFEALALNRFGDEARPWNHRLVAHRFGGGPAIESLTRLYEQARYAPGDAPLSAGDRESANRSLTQLAGGA